MKDYGMILADNGSSFFFSGASYSVDAGNSFALTFDDNDIQDSLRGLKSVHYGDFEVVDLTPAVTSLSAGSGAAGTTVTITGQNFSGAAGHLQILFGNTPATNVRVIDDGHASAVVPAGSGTVDVRVESGVNAPGHSNNIKDPIFGYGRSAITSAERFTYGTGGPANAPPPTVTAASAAPAQVTGKTSVLGVLGGDDQGESNLSHVWLMLSGPAGAHPTFSANGTNAAKNTMVTFERAGSYIFRAVLTDAGGLSITSDVSVSVTQTLTSIRVSPAAVTVTPGGRVQFVAAACDQFGSALIQQPRFTWQVVNGPGSIGSTGLYSAPNRNGVSATVQASTGAFIARATVQVRRRSTASLAPMAWLW